MKLCTNIKHYLTMCREKTRNSTYILYGIMPLWNFPCENCVCSIIPSRIFSWNLVQILSVTRWCGEKKGQNSSTFLQSYAPLKLPVWKSCPLYNLKPVKEIFMNLGRKKIVSDNVQRTRTVTLPSIFVKLSPFHFFMKVLSALYL